MDEDTAIQELNPTSKFGNPLVLFDGKVYRKDKEVDEKWYMRCNVCGVGRIKYNTETGEGEYGRTRCDNDCTNTPSYALSMQVQL